MTNRAYTNAFLYVVVPLLCAGSLIRPALDNATTGHHWAFLFNAALMVANLWLALRRFDQDYCGRSELHAATLEADLSEHRASALLANVVYLRQAMKRAETLLLHGTPITALIEITSALEVDDDLDTFAPLSESVARYRSSKKAA
jgi:hypothetical protein